MKKIVLSFVLVASLFGEGEDEFGDDFSEEFAIQDVASTKAASPKQAIDLTKKENFLDDFLEGFNYKGKISLLSAYNYIDDIELTNGNDIRGLSSFRLFAILEAGYKINKNHKLLVQGKAYYDDVYSLNSANYPNIPETYEEEIRLGEAYLTGTINENMDYKIGRQIVVWGKSDSLRVADILNPMDNRNPGITDIENLRLPVGMIKLDWYDGDWNFGVIDIFEQRFSKMPKYGSGYISLSLPDITMPDNKQQIALYANGRFNGWDLSLYGADKYNDQFYLDANLVMSKTGASITKELKIDRVQIVGTSANAVAGPFLLKAEVVYLKGVQYSDTIDTDSKPPEISSYDEKDVLNSLLGVDLMINDGTISFEISDSHIYDYESSMSSDPFKQKEDTIIYSARYSQSFFHDKLSINYLTLLQGKELEGGGFQRAWTNYKQSDNFSYDVGVVEYIGGDSFFYEGMKDSDKVFVNAKYSF